MLKLKEKKREEKNFGGRERESGGGKKIYIPISSNEDSSIVQERPQDGY